MSMPTPTTRPIVVSGSHDATVRVWDLDSRELLYEPLKATRARSTRSRWGRWAAARSR